MNETTARYILCDFGRLDDFPSHSWFCEACNRAGRYVWEQHRAEKNAAQHNRTVHGEYAK